MKNCMLCPRRCGADRTKTKGACGEKDKMRVAKAMLHFFEEPPISGTKGSGAIFFYGCNLRCGYCQNAAVSRDTSGGGEVSEEELYKGMLDLQQQGAHNINLVTAAHFAPLVARALRRVKPRLTIPVVYNSSGYELPEALALFEGLVDVYLPDFKYADSSAAKRYSAAEDYPCVAQEAIKEMVRQVGAYREEGGLVKKGVIVRHLVLPGLSRDGERVMRIIAEKFPCARVSVMRQYTPDFNKTGDPHLDRTVTSLEYNRVVNAARELGLEGFMQGADSVGTRFTPDF
ncbi:MAG: radical SAM protein [Clostridiales bacterium]|nr:radical SAM protein [Clostridiales bacterium]